MLLAQVADFARLRQGGSDVALAGLQEYTIFAMRLKLEIVSQRSPL